MSQKRVTVLGGTGFVGSHLCYQLAGQFSEVVVPTRRKQRVKAGRVLPNLRFVEADIHDRSQLDSVLAGSDVVINLIGLLNESGKQSKNSFAGAHEVLTSNVIAACKSQYIPRYLHVSALNADASEGSSEYLKSKGRAELAIKQANSDLSWTIFQPSVIFGENDSFFNRFADLLRALPVFPLACPDSRMAPVYVGDVCDVIIDAINDGGSHGKIIQLCGPDVKTLRELVEYTAETAGINSRIINLPDGLARLQASIMEFVPGKPFSKDNYLSLQTDSVCSGDCTPQPTSMDAITPRYLGKKEVNNQHQTYRRWARR